MWFRIMGRERPSHGALERLRQAANGPNICCSTRHSHRLQLLRGLAEGGFLHGVSWLCSIGNIPKFSCCFPYVPWQFSFKHTQMKIKTVFCFNSRISDLNSLLLMIKSPRIMVKTSSGAASMALLLSNHQVYPQPKIGSLAQFLHVVVHWL